MILQGVNDPCAALLASKKPDVSQISPKIASGFRNLIRVLLYGEFQQFSLSHKNNLVQVPVLPGHLWTRPDKKGPVQKDVMVVDKMLYNDDLDAGGAMAGTTCLMFLEQLRKEGLRPDHWYVTNFIKCQHPEWDTQTTTVTAPMRREFTPLLQQEILLVQPKVILCLGADALRGVLGQQITMEKADETLFSLPVRFPLLPDRKGDVIHPETGAAVPWDIYLESMKDEGYAEVPVSEITVIGIPHPHSILRAGDTGSLEKLSAAIRFFGKSLREIVPEEALSLSEDAEEEPTDYRVIRSLDEYEALAEEIEKTCKDNLIAVDAEWNGSHPQNTNAYLRCFQLSWKPYTAACVALAPQTDDCELRRAYYYQGEERTRLLEITKRIVSGRRLAGHFIEADLEFLVPFGIDLRGAFRVPKSPEEYKRKWLAGEACGFDTGRAAHAVEETAELSLKEQARQHTGAGRYDKALERWKDENTLKKSARGVPVSERSKKKKLDGYGIIPDELLYKYASYDADVTRRLALVYTERLSGDRFGNDCWRPFWIAMRALPAILEINRTGLLLDRERLEELTVQYQNKTEELLSAVREWARWPDFNPRSSFQMREFLFGARYNRKALSKKELESLPEGTAPPEFVRVRPKGARTMELPPLQTTDKYPRLWADVEREGRSHLATPSTDRKVLAQLEFFHSKKKVTLPDGTERVVNLQPVLEKLRQYQLVSQTLKYVLKPPVTDETEAPVYNSEGDLLYDSGIPSCVCDDGRVRTSIYPTKR
jgi:uracil-DNA glycosylase family 4